MKSWLLAQYSERHRLYQESARPVGKAWHWIWWAVYLGLVCLWL